DDHGGPARASVTGWTCCGRRVGSRTRCDYRRGTGGGGAAPIQGSAPEPANQAMKLVVYDTGVLIAADRNERRVWVEHRFRLEAGLVPMVPAPVLAQASRSPEQAQM